MGLQLAEQLGEENIKAYLLANSKWCKFLMIFCFCITGCCCCLCCCCCFNWCCGKCKPKSPDAYDYDDFQVNTNSRSCALSHSFGKGDISERQTDEPIGR